MSERISAWPPKARKRFGQHFLVDRNIVRKIVSSIQPAPEEVVVEIGPGRGALTGLLVEVLPRLVAVEIDRDLAAELHRRFPEPRLRLIEGDILHLDLAALLHEEGGARLLVVGNLPYNITAPLLFRLLTYGDRIGRAVLMVQREVARRLVAQPGSKEYGRLTVQLAMQAQVRALLDVDRRAFRPIPRVDATVVEVCFVPEWRYPVQDRQMFVRLTQAVFGQRRKMLRNSLLELVGAGGRALLEELAESTGIELTRRPESLQLEEFARLSDQLAWLKEREG